MTFLRWITSISLMALASWVTVIGIAWIFYMVYREVTSL